MINKNVVAITQWNDKASAMKKLYQCTGPMNIWTSRCFLYTAFKGYQHELFIILLLIEREFYNTARIIRTTSHNNIDGSLIQYNSRIRRNWFTRMIAVVVIANAPLSNECVSVTMIVNSNCYTRINLRMRISYIVKWIVKKFIDY